MKETNVAQRGGVGFFGLLTLIFITLKLTGFINWSWWLVTLPLWGGLALVVVLLALFFIIALVANWLPKR